MTAAEARERTKAVAALKGQAAQEILKQIYTAVAEAADHGQSAIDMEGFFRGVDAMMKPLILKDLEEKGFKVDYGHQLAPMFYLRW